VGPPRLDCCLDLPARPLFSFSIDPDLIIVHIPNVLVVLSVLFVPDPSPARGYTQKRGKKRREEGGKRRREGEKGGGGGGGRRREEKRSCVR